MAYPERKVISPRLIEKDVEQEPWKFKLELNPRRIVLYGFSLVVVLVWMFAFGVLVGREMPLIDPNEISLKAQVVRLLGLGRQPAPKPENPAATWETPEKMVSTLKYHESLAEGAPATLGLPPANSQESRAPAAPAAPSPAPAPTNPPEPKKPAASAVQPPAKREPAAETPGERYTILVATLKSKDGAQRHVEQLKAKGYSARLEVVEGRLFRVMVGSFDNRDRATKFAGELSKREMVEANVMREAQ